MGQRKKVGVQVFLNDAEKLLQKRNGMSKRLSSHKGKAYERHAGVAIDFPGMYHTRHNGNNSLHVKEQEHRLAIVGATDAECRLRQVFDKLLSEKSTGSGETRGQPARRLQDASKFIIEHDGSVSLDELEQCFAGTENPRRSAANMISWLRDVSDRLGLDLEVKSETRYTFTRRH